MARAEHTEVVDAPAASCFAAVADLESHPSWQRAVRSVTVLERDGDGRPAVAESVTDAKVREVRYTLRYAYEPPTRISWTYVRGDAKHVEGEYRFEDLGDGRTRVTHRLDVDAGGPLVPGRVKQGLAEQAVQSSLRALARHLAAGA
jgi:uncharacterized membrane protein